MFNDFYQAYMLRSSFSKVLKSLHARAKAKLQYLEMDEGDLKCAVCNKNEGLSLCSGCKVWMRFMATR